MKSKTPTYNQKHQLISQRYLINIHSPNLLKLIIKNY